MVERGSRRAARPLATALAALALAGCAADYVGDDWQCPLAQGKVCASVAAADPAVPATQGTASLDDDISPYRRLDGRIAAGASAGRGEPACESECDPLAWFAGLFAGPTDAESAADGWDDDTAEAGRTVSARNRHAAPEASASRSADTAHGPASAAGHSETGSPAGASTAIASDRPDDAPPPAPDRAANDAGIDEASGPAAPDALRTGEVVARIWIAPFVDADGIYREGSWVRAVIAPAAWRLP